LHDGRPLTAKDAIYVLRDRTTDPKSTYKEAFADIKANDIKLLDTRTFAAPTPG
jgi:hypothetical protein